MRTGASRPGSRALAQLAELANAGAVGVGARAVEEPVEVAVSGPGASSSSEDAEDDVEDRVGQSVAYGDAHKREDDLYTFPTHGTDEAYGGARYHGSCWGIEEFVVATGAVDDLRRYED